MSILSILLQGTATSVGTKIFRFWVVGTCGYGLDLSVTYLLLNAFKVKKYIANSAGFLSGLTLNFFFNRKWTFANSDPKIMEQYIKFAVIGLIGLGIVNGVTYLLHDKRKIPFVIAKTLAMFVFFFFNFFANYLYTFA